MRSEKASWILTILALVIATAIARPASAQTEVGIGYQFVRLTTYESNYPVGFNADVAVPLGSQESLKILTELGWSRYLEDSDGVTGNLINLGGGIRFSVPTSGQASPYGQAIIGYQRDTADYPDGSDTYNSLIFGFDGGVQAPASEAMDIFGQAGYRWVNYEGDDSNGFRFIAGIRIRVQ